MNYVCSYTFRYYRLYTEMKRRSSHRDEFYCAQKQYNKCNFELKKQMVLNFMPDDILIRMLSFLSIEDLELIRPVVLIIRFELD